jgi:hypothetical protein
MDITENKDQQIKTIKDGLFQKFVTEFDMVLMDFKNKDKISITETFLKMARLAIDPVMLQSDTSNDKLIKNVYLEELVKKFKKDFVKVDQARLNKYFIRQEIFSHINDKQFDTLKQLELQNLVSLSNEKLTFEIFGEFMSLVEKYLNNLLPELYLKVEPPKTTRAAKPGSENKIQKIVNWKGSKVDFIKLVYALCISNQIEHKKGVTVITEALAQAMGVDYVKDSSELHASILDAKKNGNDLYSFFDELKAVFQSYVESNEKAKILKN